MLAMYNLNVGNNIYPDGKIGIQNENVVGWREGENTAYGIVDFSTDNYWYDELNDSILIDTDFIDTGKIAPYVYGNYEENLVYQYVNEYEMYLKEEIGIIDAQETLMSVEQSESLGCDDSSEWCDSSYDWVYSTNYWLGSVVPHNYYSISNVMLDKNYNKPMGYTAGGTMGIRPIIIISSSYIE